MCVCVFVCVCVCVCVCVLWQELKAMVITEQEEFQKFVYKHAKVNHYLFNFIHPDVWDTFKVN